MLNYSAFILKSLTILFNRTSLLQIVTMVAAGWRCTLSVSGCGHWRVPSAPRLWEAPAQPTENLFRSQG